MSQPRLQPRLDRRRFLGGAAAAAAASRVTAVKAQALAIRVAYVPVIGAAAIFVADGAGWTKDAGLSLSLSKFDSGPPAIGALASGTIDALAIGIAPVAVARAKGLDVTVVSAMATGGSGFVASADLAADFGRSNNDPAAALAAFHRRAGRPAKLATLPPGGVPTVTLNHWLFKLHATARADAAIVTMGIEAIQQAMLTGGVDGATVLEPALTLVRQRDPKLALIATADAMLPGIPGVVLAVSGAFSRAQPRAVDSLVGLIARATDLVKTHPQGAAAYVQPVLGGGLVARDVFAQALTSKAVTFVADPRTIVEPTRRMLAYQVELGDFAQAPATDGLFEVAPFLHTLTK